MKSINLLSISSLLLFLSISSFAHGPDEKVHKSFMERMDIPRELIIGSDTITYRPKWFIPSHYSAQYAGLVGFMSIGAGYDFGRRYKPTLYYGLLSHNFGGSSVTVHTISLKNSWDLFKPGMLGNLTPRAGFSINWGHTNNTFHRLPPHYPDKYYFQNKVHLVPFWGGEYKISLNGNGLLKKMGIYAEMSTLDAYVLEMIRTKYVTPFKIWNLSMGVTLYLN